MGLREVVKLPQLSEKSRLNAKHSNISSIQSGKERAQKSKVGSESSKSPPLGSQNRDLQAHALNVSLPNSILLQVTRNKARQESTERVKVQKKNTQVHNMSVDFTTTNQSFAIVPQSER